MFQEFPYTNFHELNLDWIVKIAKDFLDQYTHIQEVIQTGLDDLSESRETGLEELDQKRLDSLAELNQKTIDGLADLQEKYDTLDGLLQAWYDTHSADIAGQLADAISDFNAAAEAKSQALLDSWPADYSELVNEYTNIKNSMTIPETDAGSQLVYGYIGTNGVVVPDGAGNRRHTGMFFVTPGSTIKYIGESNHQSINGISFYDKNKTYISGDSNSGPNGEWQEVSVPDSAVFAMISTNTTFGFKVGFKRANPVYGDTSSIPTVLNDRFKEIESDITEIDNVIDDIEGFLSIAENGTGASLVYGYIGTDGVVVPDGQGNRRHTAMFFVAPGATIKYIGESNHQNINGISFYDKNKTYISGDSNSGPNGEWQEVSVPDSAVFAMISTNTTFGFKVGFKRANPVYGDTSSIPAVLNDRFKTLERTGMEYAYVSFSTGNDSTGNGTKTSPFKTIGKALTMGYRKISAKPEVYNEFISLTGGDFELIPWVDNESFSTSVPDRQNIKIIKGTKLEIEASESEGIYQASFTPDSGSNIYKVFVSHALTPTTQGSLSLEYNALLVEDVKTTKQETGYYPANRNLYLPVLTEEELTSEGTFYYSDGVLKIHPFDGFEDSDFYVSDDSNANGIYLLKLNNVHFENVTVMGCYNNCMLFEKCNNVSLDACYSAFCAKGMGYAFIYTNVYANMCIAFAISTDGFNMHRYGNSEIVNCSAFNCGDDGISQHEGCTGLVNGGEWHHNNDGGITPAFGAKIDVINVYSHDNGKGIAYYGSNDYQRRSCIVNASVFVDNTTDVYVDRKYDIVLSNTVYETKDDTGDATITEYGNTVLN